eukprot:6484908-Amphidinium_carterae.1
MVSQSSHTPQVSMLEWKSAYGRSARAVPDQASHSASLNQPSIADLRKTKTSLPALLFASTVPFQLIKAWKEWVFAVQLKDAGWNEHAPPYWQTVLH